MTCWRLYLVSRIFSFSPYRDVICDLYSTDARPHKSICTLDLSEGDVGYRGNGKNVVRTMKSHRVVNNRWSLRYLTSFVSWFSFSRSLWLVLWRTYALIGYAFGYASRATFFCSHKILMLPVKHPWQHLLNRHTSRMFFLAVFFISLKITENINMPRKRSRVERSCSQFRMGTWFSPFPRFREHFPSRFFLPSSFSC